MAKAYTATLVKKPDSPRTPPALIYADTDADALAQAHRILGPNASFDLLDGERVVFTHRAPDALGGLPA